MSAAERRFATAIAVLVAAVVVIGLILTISRGPERLPSEGQVGSVIVRSE